MEWESKKEDLIFLKIGIWYKYMYICRYIYYDIDL